MLIKLDWSCHGYKLAAKILKLQRKTIFSENVITENPENTPFVTQGSPDLIREGGRTVGSGRAAVGNVWCVDCYAFSFEE